MPPTASNALILQSGGCTPVLNRSLFGAAAEALSRREIGAVYGARRGIEGLLKDDIIDLYLTSKPDWRRIARLPAAALGTTRHSPKPEEIPAILDCLKRLGVRFLFIIGGNDSAATGNNLAAAAQSAGQALSVVNIPKTIDNDLVLTDHTPGYGSAARFIALATLGAGLDAEAMSSAAPITFIEVMGRDAGWLAASAALAKRDERDAPHVLGLPEVPIEEDAFIGKVEEAYHRHGFCVAVIAENVRGPGGSVFGGDTAPLWEDAFGHKYFTSPTLHLARVAAKRLKVRVRDEKPGTIQRSFIPSLSIVDSKEAEEAGRAAVRRAIAGESSVIVTLVRQGDSPYRCTTGSAPLDKVANAVRRLPDDYIDRAGYFVTGKFLKYARPLIGPSLPAPTRFS